MNITPLKPAPLTIYPWGDGIADLRYFTPQILMPSELEPLQKATGYVPQAYTLDSAVEAINLTLKDAPPGIYFAGNPLEGTYGKWNIALLKAGFARVPGCALNRVWGNWQAYKGPGTLNPAAFDPATKTVAKTYQVPWYSPDGFTKWIHAFYKIVPGRVAPIEWDFTAKTRNLNAHNGDADLHGGKGSLWHINYGGSPQMMAKYQSGPAWCRNFARLSKSCGIAMGMGLPECGPALDEEFYTIAALPLKEAFPTGYVPFLEYGGYRFATNLDKLKSTAQTSCPHPMTV